MKKLRIRLFSCLVALALMVLGDLAAAGPAAADVAAAKQRFETGLKLLKEGLAREALAAFLDAKRLAPRESIQRNIAHTYRELRDFGAAYDANIELLETFGDKMGEASRKKVQLAIEELKMMTGVIRIGVTEAGARVQVDSREVGRTPFPRPLRFNLGGHEVRVDKDGFEPLVQRVELQAGNQEVTVTGPLEKLATTGRLGVTVAGGGRARLSIDGVDRGLLPFEGDIDPGVHDLVAHSKTAASVPRRVEVERGKRVDVSLELVSAMGTVRVDPADSAAEILLDGRTVGKGAWEGDVTPGRHEVEIRRPSFRPHKRTVLVTAGQVASVGNVTFVASTADAGGRALRGEPLQPHDFTGAYVNLALFGAFAIGGARDSVFDPCAPKALNIGSCTTGVPAGGGLALRVGHSFGWWALEGALLGEYDTWMTRTLYEREVFQPESSEHIGVARQEEYRFHRIGAGAAVGGRATSKHRSIRFTSGLVAGVLHRRVGYAYQTESQQREGNSADTTAHVSAFAAHWLPVTVLDAGVLIGATPGTKAYLGLQLQLDLGGSDGLFAPGSDNERLEGRRVGVPRVRVAEGTQWFAGPVLGLQFGE